MNKKVALGLLLMSLIILSTTISTVSATDYTKVGVRVGDIAGYASSTLTGFGETSTGIGTITVVGYYIEILQIAGTNVTINVRDIFPDNSKGPNIIVFGNVSSSDSQILLYLIPANLSQGDNIGTDSYHIDRTTTMIVGGTNRTVNHLQGYPEYISVPGAPFNPGGPDIVNSTLSYDAYYDKITGLLVKADITNTVYYGGNYWEVYTYIQTLTSTTVFPMQNTTFASQNPEANTIAPILITAAGIAIAVTMVAVAIAQHRRQKTTTN